MFIRNMKKKLVLASAIVGSSAIFFSATIAAAEIKYPVETVTLVTHSSPGGGSDVYLREMAKYLGPALGVDMVVKNVRGGSSSKAIAYVAQSDADGSVFYGSTPVYLNMTLLSDPEFGAMDLEPVVNFFLDPQIIYVRAESSFHSLKDVIAHAKSKPGKQKWGTGTPASLERIALERFKSIADVDITIVTHDGGGDMMINVLNGSLDLGIGEVQEIRGQLDAGKLRVISTFTQNRLKQFPKVTTAIEEGSDMVVNKFRGLVGPKGLPKDVIAAWEAAVPKVLADPKFQEWFDRRAMVETFMTQDKAIPFVANAFEEQDRFFIKYGIKQK